MSMKNSNDYIGNRTRNIPALFLIIPQIITIALSSPAFNGCYVSHPTHLILFMSLALFVQDFFCV
jgi:hypothetical protein